jgi:hypothetical protein
MSLFAGLPEQELDALASSATEVAFGEGETLAVLSSGRRTASVVAKTPVRALRWFKTDVWALDGRAPGATERLRAALDAHRA